MSQPSPDWLVVSPIAALAGAFGALISLRSLDDLTPRGRVVAVAGGFGCSVFLTPLTAEGLHAWLDWAIFLTPRGEAGIAFALGLLGLSVVGEIAKMLPMARDWAARVSGDRRDR